MGNAKVEVFGRNQQSPARLSVWLGCFGGESLKRLRICRDQRPCPDWQGMGVFADHSVKDAGGIYDGNSFRFGN